MKKTEFIALVAEKADCTKKDAEKALNAVIDSIEEVLVAGDKLQLMGFGTFETKKRPARTCRNPRTGEQMPVAAATVPAFKPGSQLKEKVNK